MISCVWIHTYEFVYINLCMKNKFYRILHVQINVYEFIYTWLFNDHKICNDYACGDSPSHKQVRPSSLLLPREGHLWWWQVMIQSLKMTVQMMMAAKIYYHVLSWSRAISRPCSNLLAATESGAAAGCWFVNISFIDVCLRKGGVNKFLAKEYRWLGRSVPVAAEFVE